MVIVSPGRLSMGLLAAVLSHLQKNFWPLRLMGLCPVDFITLKFHPWRICYSLTVVVSLFVFCFLCEKQLCGSRFSYLPSVYRLPQCFALQVFILLFLFRRNSFISLLEDFIRVECKMKELGVTFIYTRPPCGHALTAFFLLLVSILFKGYGLGVLKDPFGIPGVIGLFEEYVFVFSLIVVNYGLSIFMYCPIDLLKATTAHFRLIIESTKIKNAQYFVKFAVIQENICNLSEFLNSYFSFQILFYLTACFLTLLTSAYYAFRSFNEINFLIAYLSMGILVIINLDALTGVSVMLTEMANAFNNELYRWMLNDDSGVLSNDKRLLLHISKKPEIKFTAYGLFVVDHSLITSMIAALATYVVTILSLGG